MLKHTIVALSLSILACDSPDDELMLEALDEEAELEANAELDAEARGSMAAASEQAPDASASTRLSARAQTDESLDALAKAFARAVTDSNFRKQIHDSVAQRFDGDTEVLYKTLLKAPGVRDALASAYGRARAVDSDDALGAVDRLASAIPRFQVACRPTSTSGIR